MTLRIFKITKRTLTTRKTRGSKITCQTCNDKIKPGDMIVTKNNARKGRNNSIRHKSCAMRVGVI